MVRLQVPAQPTLLVEFQYRPLFIKDLPIRVIGQVVNSGDLPYVWVDGLDRKDPILVPLTHVYGSRTFTSVQAYFRANSTELQEVVGCASSRDLRLSSLLVVRSVEAMKSDQTGPDRALDAALAWSRVLLELDEMERQAFSRPARSETLSVVGVESKV